MGRIFRNFYFTRTMKILHISRNFPPLTGGMERLNAHISRELAKTCEVAIVGPKGVSEYLADCSQNIREVAHKPLWLFFPRFFWSSLRLAFRFRPDIVFAGSGLVAPIAWSIARLTGSKFVVYVHGLDLVVDSKLYQFAWLPFIRRADMCIANSQNTSSLALSKGLATTRLKILNPGVSVPPIDALENTDFRTRHGLGERPILLSVGRLSRRKGLAEFIQFCLADIVQKRPDVLLIVIGGDSDEALYQKGSGQKEILRDHAEQAGLTQNLLLLGHCAEQELLQAYRASDLLIFPVIEQPGDVEGFGMVAMEAAANGLPTIAFDVGGISDAISTQSGKLIPAADYHAYTQAILGELSSPSIGISGCRNHAQMNSWPRFGGKLYEIFSDLLH